MSTKMKMNFFSSTTYFNVNQNNNNNQNNSNQLGKNINMDYKNPRICSKLLFTGNPHCSSCASSGKK